MKAFCCRFRLSSRFRQVCSDHSFYYMWWDWILMTSFAFISGLIPLAVASGAGALGNRSIGTAAAGGMLIGTFVGIFLIPGLYVIFESLATYLKEKKQKANEEEYEF